MPAHGRGEALPDEFRRLLQNKAGIWDLPELFDLGGPLEIDGAIAESQKQSAQEVGVDRAWYGVNGATGLLQAALLGIAKPGQAVLMPRNVHRSLIQACVIGDLTPVFFDLPFLGDRGHYVAPDSDWVQKIILSIPFNEFDIAAVVLVNPFYQGYFANMQTLVEFFHKKKLPVLVDEAHGAHFVPEVDAFLPKSSLKTSADLVVHSLHKSATGLSQTSVLWLQGSLVDPFLIDRSLGWIQSSSPSSLLLASCEAAIREWSSNIGRDKLSRRLSEARELRLALKNSGIPFLDNDDPLRLILHTFAEGFSGFDVDEWFTSKGLIGELPEAGCLTFCLGLSSHNGLLDVFKNLWEELLHSSMPKLAIKSFSKPPLPLFGSPVVSVGKAWRSDSQKKKLDDCENCLSAEMVCPYPPGIPLVIPGERLDFERLNWLKEQHEICPNLIQSQISVII